MKHSPNDDKAIGWWFTERHPEYKVTRGIPGYLYWYDEKGVLQKEPLSAIRNFYENHMKEQRKIDRKAKKDNG